MKKIYINPTRRAIVFGNAVLLPGSNVCEEIDFSKFPGLSGMVTETVDAATAAGLANTQKAADEIAEIGGDRKSREAASRRKRALDDIDAQAEFARKKKAEG